MPIKFHTSHWDKLKNPIYLETGLLNGSSLLKAYETNLFKKYISIEISQKHISNFKNKQKIPKSIQLIHGNSKNLAQYICNIDDPITFFLDAHDDQRFTEQRKQQHDDPGIKCPLLEELEAIAQHPCHAQHKIMIDDMRCFRKGFTHERHNWFKSITYAAILDTMKRLFPNHGLYLVDGFKPQDILVALPEVTSIPKIVHSTYKSKNRLPVLFEKCRNKVQQYYQDYEYRFYDDKDMEQFMEQYYPQFKTSVFDKLPLLIMKIDVFRYCLLETFGGLYIDMDHELCRRYSFTNHSLFLCMNRQKETGDSKDTIGNSIIASDKNHPFWGYIRNELKTSIDTIIKDNKKVTNRKENKNFVIENSGPKFLTKVYDKYRSKLNDIKVIPRKVFHGPKPIKIDTVFLNDVQVCGFHHCAGTWYNKRH